MNDQDPPKAKKTSAAMKARDSSAKAAGKRRPFLQRLGLRLPVTPQDVKQAYFARANETHPDHGGEAVEFRRVQEAFDEAIEFARRSGKRLPWLGAQMPVYVAQRDVTELVQTFSGTVTIEHLDWLAETVGSDFALLADRLTEIDLSGCDIGDDQLRLLLGNNAEGLAYLRTLKLSGTRATDASVALVANLPSVERLDISGVRVSARLVAKLTRLPRMRSVEGAGFLARLLGRFIGG